MRLLPLLLVAAWLTNAAPLFAQAGVHVGPPKKPNAAVQHVCIISVDGLRPDRALWANMPNLRELARSGTYTFWAKTTPLAVTLPSHVSMLSGVAPWKHGVEWNTDLPFSRPVYPKVPTIFELAVQSGYTTAAIAGKSKFTVLNEPGALTYVAISEKGSGSNAWVVAEASRIIEAHRPTLVFVHFPEVDATGHRHGWGSAEQLSAIEQTDVHLGELLQAFVRAGIRESTVFILSADHGGTGLGHGPDDPRSRYIPWIAQGPGIRANFDLTQLKNYDVNTEDTAATALHVLGIALLPNFDGKPIMPAFLD